MAPYKSSSAHEELPIEHEDPLIKVLHGAIHFAVRILMTLVILWSVADVVYQPESF